MKQKEKQDVAIIEFGAHVLQLDHLSFLLGGRSSASVVCRVRNEQQASRDNFHFSSDEKTFLYDCRSGKYFGTLGFYFRTLERLKNARLVWISTGPEQNNLPDLIFLVTVFMLKREKLVLNIRDISKWMQSEKGGLKQRLANFLRQLTQQRARRITFETTGQEDEFKKRFVSHRSLTCAVPTQFSDYIHERVLLPSPWLAVLQDSSRTDLVIRLGVLGGIDPGRKDYGLLKSAIELLPSGVTARLELVFLGGIVSPESYIELEEFAEMVTISFSQSFLTASDFYVLGSGCNFLIAPLRLDRGYGLVKGSGAFGDAVGLGKWILAPDSTVPGEEYLDLIETYKDYASLAVAIEKFSSTRGFPAPTEQSLAWFSRDSVLDRIKDRLKIDL